MEISVQTSVLFYFIFPKDMAAFNRVAICLFFWGEGMSCICTLLQHISTDRIIQKRNKQTNKQKCISKKKWIHNKYKSYSKSVSLSNIWNTDLSTIIFKCLMVKLILKMKIEDLFKKYLSLLVWTWVCHEFFNLSIYIKIMYSDTALISMFLWLLYEIKYMKMFISLKS